MLEHRSELIVAWELLISLVWQAYPQIIRIKGKKETMWGNLQPLQILLYIMVFSMCISYNYKTYEVNTNYQVIPAFLILMFKFHPIFLMIYNVRLENTNIANVK